MLFLLTFISVTLGVVTASTEPSAIDSQEYHSFDPEVITQIVGSGEKGIRISFYDGAGGDGYLGQITWRNPIMPQLGVYLQFMTGKGTKKWVPASDEAVIPPKGELVVSLVSHDNELEVHFRGDSGQTQTAQIPYKGSMQRMGDATYIKIDKFNGIICEVMDEEDTCREATTAPATTQKPTTTPQPTTEKPTTEQPTTEQPTTEQPTTEQPTTEQPTTEQPTTEQGSPSTPKSEGSTEQSEGSTEQSEGSTEPSEGSTEQSEGSSEPSEGSSEPSEGSDSPSEGSTEPSQGSTEPSEGSTEQSQGSDSPSEGSSEPSEGSSEPSQGSDSPSEGSTTPSEGSDEQNPTSSTTTSQGREGSTSKESKSSESTGYVTDSQETTSGDYAPTTTEKYNRETTERTYSGSMPSDSPTMESNDDKMTIREDCSESGIGIYFDDEVSEAGMCRDYERIPFQLAEEDMENVFEELEKQSEKQSQQMQSLVQSHDDLRMENYQLKEKLNMLENSMEMYEDKYESMSEKMEGVLRAIEKLKSRTGDDDDSDSDSDNIEDRQCSGVSSFGACYELSEKTMTYNKAKAYCKSEGGMLATWSSDMNVHRELLDYAVDQEIPLSQYIWIGASYDSKTDRSTWADGREMDIKVTRFTKQTSCGSIFKRYIAGFKCSNEHRVWCQFGSSTEM